MHNILPLNNRTQDHVQTIEIPVLLPDYTQRNTPHGEITITAKLHKDGLLLEFKLRSEEHKLLYSQRWAYTATELITNAKARHRKE